MGKIPIYELATLFVKYHPWNTALKPGNILPGCMMIELVENWPSWVEVGFDGAVF